MAILITFYILFLISVKLPETSYIFSASIHIRLLSSENNCILFSYINYLKDCTNLAIFVPKYLNIIFCINLKTIWTEYHIISYHIIYASVEFTKLSCLQYTSTICKAQILNCKTRIFVLFALEQSHFHCQSFRLYTWKYILVRVTNPYSDRRKTIFASYYTMSSKFPNAM